MPRQGLSRNKFIALAITLSSLFLSVIAQGGQDHAKEKFTSKEGAFSIKLPGEPKQNSEDISSLNGPTTLHTFVVEDTNDKCFYMVGYSDYQTKLDEASSLDAVINAQLKGMKGTITSDKKVTLNGHAGRSVTIEGEETVYYSSVYVAGNRLYQVLYGRARAEAVSAAAREFLDSFEILI
jgi:hypothetical protein